VIDIDAGLQFAIDDLRRELHHHETPQERRVKLFEVVLALETLQAQRVRLGEVVERLAKTAPLPPLPEARR